MAGRVLARSCVQTGLKTVNSVVGLAGMAVILYALWMLRGWSKQLADLHHHFPSPGAGVLQYDATDGPTEKKLAVHQWDQRAPIALWFVYAFLGLGIVLCLLTCSGHIAAETANGHCLACHMIFVCFLVILEGAIAADVFLNSNWEEDFPDDPSGKFDEFKHFLRSNFEICEWVALSVVAGQVLSIILAMVLRALGPDREIDYDSDDDISVPARLPLLRNQARHSPNYIEPNLSRRSDSWNLRILGKANK